MYGNSSIFTDSVRCNQEEYRTHRCNLVLDGINLIINSILQGNEEEDLINTCLSVAIEITGSQIGFIGEVTSDRLLHDLDVSDRVLKNCYIYEKSGHKWPHRYFILIGKYGNIIEGKKGFFTNDPLSYPGSIGMLHGHPLLTSFLGVPLIEEGKAIGVLAVANREKGYSCKQLEELETIAPAVTQALRRKKDKQELKKAEKVLHDAYEQIQAQSDELQMQSDELQLINEKLMANSKEIQIKNKELQAQSEELKKANEDLEEKVKQRTAKLEEAYNLLKESEKGLAEAQSIAHIGNWEQNFATNKLQWSDEVYRIFGLKPQEFEVTYSLFSNYVHPDDRDYLDNAIKDALDGKPIDVDFRIIPAHGKERVAHAKGEVIFDETNNPIRIRGIIQDITESKKAEEALARIETSRKQEIHHRIKNNLQVISSLLDLQAEKFNNRKCIEDSEVKKAFRESQDRVISMALLHEEFYKGGGLETLNFSQYLEELAENLLQTYRIGSKDISLKMEMAENAFFDMDIAVPLGLIINELVSNSLKHAFVGRDGGEIKIKLSGGGTPVNI